MAGQPSPYTARARGVVVARIGCLVAGGAIALAGPSSAAAMECDKTPEVGLKVVFVGGLGSTELSTAARNSRTSTTPSSRVGDRLSGRT